MHDRLLLDSVNRSINLSVPWFLMTSYLYYQEGVSIVSDETFDSLCKMMQERWDDVTHPHKVYISIEDLKAGSGFAVKIPDRAKFAAMTLVKKQPETLEDFFD